MNLYEAIQASAKVTRDAWHSNAAYVRREENTLFWGSKDHPEQHYVPTHADLFADDWRAA